jgi:hypothetical protein
MPARFRRAVFSVGIGLTLLPLVLAIPAAALQIEVPSRPVDASVLVPRSSAVFLSAPVQVSARKATSGESVVPTQRASGSVLIRNKSSDALLLPPGIEIQASATPVLFVTSSSAVIDPDQTAWIGVQAVSAGTSGNLPAGSLATVQGPLGLALEVRASTAMRGGQNELRAVVTTDDLQSLRKQLEGDFQAQAMLRLQGKASAGTLLIPDTLTTLGPVESEPDAAAGTAVDTVGMTLSGVATILAFNSSEIQETAVQALAGHLGQGEVLDLSQMTQELSGSPNGDAWLVVHARAYPTVDVGGLAQALRLQQVRETGTIIRSHCPPGTTYQIAVAPSWLPLMPLYPWRIYASARPL